jgi:hypothetical protein
MHQLSHTGRAPTTCSCCPDENNLGVCVSRDPVGSHCIRFAFAVNENSRGTERKKLCNIHEVSKKLFKNPADGEHGRSGWRDAPNIDRAAPVNHTVIASGIDLPISRTTEPAQERSPIRSASR